MTPHPERPRLLLIGIQNLLPIAARTFDELGYALLICVPREHWGIVAQHDLAALGHEVFQFDGIGSDEVHARAAEFAPDYILTIIFGERVPQTFTALAGRLALNLHPASLPEFRSGNPWFWPIRKGAVTSALTVHRLAPRWDAGDILYRHPFELGPNDTQGIYAERVAANTGPCCIALDQVLRAPEPALEPQPPSPYYPRIRLRDIAVTWAEEAASITCLVRACNPNHYAETLFRGLVVQLVQVTPSARRCDKVWHDDGTQVRPGDLVVDRSGLFCATGDFFLRIDVVSVHQRLVGTGARFASTVGVHKKERFEDLALDPRFAHLLDRH